MTTPHQTHHQAAAEAVSRQALAFQHGQPILRTYTPAHRQPWQDPIKFILRAIDLHTAHGLASGNPFHHRQAEILRTYLSNLKDWIATQDTAT